MSVRQQHLFAFTLLRPSYAGALLAGLLLTWSGCVLPAPEEETGQLYHHNWWNYYGRGTYLLKQNRVEEAQADFQRCLGLVPGAKFGNTHDMWRARTYGLHFVEGYFPNRELGVCLYERSDVTQAIHYLELSLRQEPSGRAKHYLNLALRQQMAGLVIPAPQLRLDNGEEVAYTRDRACVLNGTATGAGRIRHLTVGGHPEFIELAAASFPFKRRVALAAGTNVVPVEAEDLLGQRAVRKVVRIADWQAPRFLVRRVIAQGSEWLVEGVCRDEFGIAEIALGTKSVFRHAGERASEEVPVSLHVPLTGATLKAADLAGNGLECPLTATVLAQAAFQERAVLRLAEVPRPSRPPAAGLPAMGVFAVNGAVLSPYATVLDRMDAWARASRCSDHEVAVRLASQTAPVPTGDRLRPSLSLRGCQPLTRVFTEEFFVDGTAADGGGLASVTINGEDLLAQQDQGSIRTYFARRIPLDPGTNRFDIVATDRSGNRTSEALTVVCLRPEHLDDSLRLSVGVPPLTPVETGTVGVRVKRFMEAELLRTPVRFRLLERNEGWDFVLREQGLSVSDLADPSSALRIGKMVPAELLLMGKIYTEARGLTVYLKAVETGRGEVVFASDVYSPDQEAGLDDAVSGLVLKVEQGFPLVSGAVLRRQGSLVTLNIGRQDGATENSRFLVFSAADDDGVVAGQVCKAEGQPVQLQMERLQQNTSTARIINSTAVAIVKEGYHVYTR
ncbi:MAG: hypothetical protein WCK89_02745 [bacterium]